MTEWVPCIGEKIRVEVDESGRPKWNHRNVCAAGARWIETSIKSNGHLCNCCDTFKGFTFLIENGSLWQSCPCVCGPDYPGSPELLTVVKASTSTLCTCDLYAFMNHGCPSARGLACSDNRFHR